MGVMLHCTIGGAQIIASHKALRLSIRAIRALHKPNRMVVGLHSICLLIGGPGQRYTLLFAVPSSSEALWGGSPWGQCYGVYS